MPYVERRNGEVVGLYRRRQPGYAEELVAEDDADAVAFRARAAAAQAVVLSRHSDRDRGLALAIKIAAGETLTREEADEAAAIKRRLPADVSGRPASAPSSKA